MYGLGGLLVYAALFPHVGIEHTEISKWDIGSNYIEALVLQVLLSDSLKPCRDRCRLVVEKRQDKSCDSVFLKSVCVCSLHGCFQKAANPCARLKESAHLHTAVFESSVYLCRHGVDDELRSVERCQHGCLYTVSQCLVFRHITVRKVRQEFLQPFHRLCHVVGHGLVSADVQHLFDTSEARIQG